MKGVSLDTLIQTFFLSIPIRGQKCARYWGRYIKGWLLPVGTICYKTDLSICLCPAVERLPLDKFVHSDNLFVPLLTYFRFDFSRYHQSLPLSTLTLEEISDTKCKCINLFVLVFKTFPPSYSCDLGQNLSMVLNRASSLNSFKLSSQEVRILFFRRAKCVCDCGAQETLDLPSQIVWSEIKLDFFATHL